MPPPILQVMFLVVLSHALGSLHGQHRSAVYLLEGL